jgi:hypothetical protein
MAKQKMTITAKGELIGNILSTLRFMAATEKKAFDYGDTFLSLAFKTDSELLNIARLCGI